MSLATMPRKGIKQKHTAKELAAKDAAAKYAAGAAGGGGAGAAKRKALTTKSTVSCGVCKLAQPNMPAMTNHFESKHPHQWNEEAKANYSAQYEEIRNSLREEKFGKGKGKK
tara:strand:+ start:378 stop:713 length:336 start_codon:yes stop_codon:yes gene_type:complete